MKGSGRGNDYSKRDNTEAPDIGGSTQLGKANENEREKRRLREKQITFQNQYKSQHVQSGDIEHLQVNMVLDTMWAQRKIAQMSPSYRSGKNPDYFSEYFSDIGKSDSTNTTECQRIVYDEYEQRRWSYCQHLASYHNGETQKMNQDVDTVEFWRRFLLRNQPTKLVTAWYFDKERKLGDIHTGLAQGSTYPKGLDFMCASFSNCPTDAKRMPCLKSVHVAVGFVDLGLLLDSNIKLEGDSSLHFQGYECNLFAVAKGMVLWEMIKCPEMVAKWVVQVWFSTIWSKRATNEFLSASRRIIESGRIKSEGHAPKVGELLRLWSQSKGVGLKKLVKRLAGYRKESSVGLFFVNKCDRVDMVRYHLTGGFGLLGEEPCSASILMFDLPSWASLEGNVSVFNTLTVEDVIASKHWNGRYFETAEKVKESRMSTLIDHAQNERINVYLRVATLGHGFPAVDEIAKLQPRSVSWSNILDYMDISEFHAVAKACSATAVHFGYSMNWVRCVFGTSLIDYPEDALKVIRDAEKVTTAGLKKLSGSRRIFLTPVQNNPLNITAPLLAKRCHSYWVKHFFVDQGVCILDSSMLEFPANHLRSSLVVVACTWSYEDPP